MDRFIGLTIQKCRHSNCVRHRRIDYARVCYFCYIYDMKRMRDANAFRVAVCEWALLLGGLVEQQWASSIWRDHYSVLHEERMSVNTDMLTNCFEGSFITGSVNDFCYNFANLIGMENFYINLHKFSRIYYDVTEWLQTEFELVIEFTEHVQHVTKSNYDSLTELHTSNITVTTT
jgi:hypothetical protein